MMTMKKINEYSIIKNKKGELLITFEAINTKEFIESCSSCIFSLLKGELIIEYINDEKQLKIVLTGLEKQSILNIMKQKALMILESDEKQPFHYVTLKK